MIRYCTDDEFQQVLDLHRSEFTGGETAVAQALREGSCWVDVSQGSTMINGYVIVTYPNECAYVYSLAVSRDMRGSEIGTRLMIAAEARVRKLLHRKIWLKTTINNPAQKLYFDLGYRIDGFDPELYGPGLPGITMTKRF